MKQLQLLAIVLITLFHYTEAVAQFTFPKFLPSECASVAQNAIPGATDSRVVTVSTFGYDTGDSSTYLGLDFATGKAASWFYYVYSPISDSFAVVVMYNFPAPCTANTSVNVADSSYDSIYSVGIPPNAIEGLTLVNAVKANANYKTFAYSYPDSLPSVATLTVSTDSIFTFPGGTPYWQLFWAPVNQNDAPFTCFVHAITAETVCFSLAISSVTEEQLASQTSVFPNPADEAVTIELPSSMVGYRVRVEAFSQNGKSVVLTAGQQLTTSNLIIPTHQLSSGLWYLRISDASSPSLTAAKHLIVQH